MAQNGDFDWRLTPDELVFDRYNDSQRQRRGLPAGLREDGGGGQVPGVPLKNHDREYQAAWSRSSRERTGE